MKLLPLLLCLLLCGCRADALDTETEVPTVTAAAVVETGPLSMYDPGNPLEAKYQGNLRVYPLTMREVRGICAMEDNLLVFSGYDSTTLTLLTGPDLFVADSVTLNFELDPEDPSVRVVDGSLFYFDPERQETVVLNESLREVSRITVGEPIQGSPILSADRKTLYYSTSDAIRAWNLETGIHRTVMELSYDSQQLTGLHLNETVLQCRIQDRGTVRTLFLDAATGQLLYQQEGNVSLSTENLHYYAALPVSTMELLVFGESEGTPEILYPQNPATTNFYLPEDHAAVTAFITQDATVLDYYDLNTGCIRGQLSLDGPQSPKGIVSSSGNSIYILAYNPETDCDIVYRWNVPEADAQTADVVYTDTYVPNETVNPTELRECQTYAAELSEKYGISILVWEDALAVQPWDYTFEAETLPKVLNQELSLLDQRLSQFPESMLEQTMSHFTALKICLVRQIRGTAASGSLDTATGIQFFDGTDAYVVISVGKYSEQALYHELFHVLETHILNESTALDQWDALNPSDFVYAYSNQSEQDFSVYLSGENRAFVDSYSMSYPKEDRARVWENAILPGNAAMFKSATMQAKLASLCSGIREAYGLRKSEETFLWEQYLHTPLAYAQ